jgi:hypothetical protein
MVIVHSFLYVYQRVGHPTITRHPTIGGSSPWGNSGDVRYDHVIINI